MSPRTLPTVIERFAPLARDYDVLLCDVWGVVHNGVAAFAAACEALTRFRAGGGTVILITNAPRPGAAVQRILDRLGVPHDAYDAITSSGDVTRGIVESRLSERVFHLGPRAGPVDLRRPRRHLRAAGDRRLRGVLRPVRRCHGDAGKLSRAAGGDARAFAVHGLRQSRHRRRARRRAGLLRRRAGRRLCGARRRGALLRQAARADL